MACLALIGGDSHRQRRLLPNPLEFRYGSLKRELLNDALPCTTAALDMSLG